MSNIINKEQYKLFEDILNEFERLRNLSSEEKENLIISITSRTYIDLMCDWAFKHVFGHDERNLIPLLNDILSTDIVTIDYDSNEIDRWKGDDKNVIMDVLCHTKDGARFIVEMQRADKEYLRNRLFYYGASMASTQLKSGDYYGKLMPVVASNYGGVLRSALRNSKLSAKGLKDWKHPAAPQNIVTWVESHDTYANQGESAWLSHAQLREGWAVICARAGGTPLFFNRPKGAESVQFPGVSKIGETGNDEYFHPEVVAVNKFRTVMNGEPEELLNGDDTSVLIIKRGEKGLVIVNSSAAKAGKVSVPIAFADGTYKDKANGIKFTVKDGILTGKVPKQKVCVIY